MSTLWALILTKFKKKNARDFSSIIGLYDALFDHQIVMIMLLMKPLDGMGWMGVGNNS